jgi:hypothetical protein
LNQTMPVKTEELSMLVKDSHDDVKPTKAEKQEAPVSNSLTEASPG